MQVKPYVGITGPVSLEEIELLNSEFKDAGFSDSPCSMPMIGILASMKTLMRQEVSNRRYPLLEDIQGLLSSIKENTFKTIHYNTRELDTIYNQINYLIKGFCDEGLVDGIQLNIVFPPLSQVKRIKKRFPNLEIIFQANNGVIQSGNAKQVAEKIQGYGDTIDYVLIDPSGGRGREFHIDQSVEIANALKEKNPHLGIGFAGGFNGENIYERISKLGEKLGNYDFSIDAESGLRDKLSNEYGDDVMNFGRVRDYLQEASRKLN